MAVTLGVNTFCYKIDDGKLTFVPDLSGAAPIKQGQIAVFDATLNGALGGIRPVVTQADMAKYAGIADQNSILTSLNEKLPTVVCGFQNVYFMPTTAADVYTYGQKVFYNEVVADGQTITNGTNAGARTVPVGYIILPNESMMGGILSITGAAGLSIMVAVSGNYPVFGIA
jgi:hypothetical protein